MRTGYLMMGLALPVAGALLQSCGGEKKEEAPKKPNVLIILADDLGWGDVSFNGSKTINTPNLDALANNGINFTNGYATSATSTPSRYAMFTGAYPWRNPRAKILAGDAPLLMAEDQFTMPKMMQKLGYVTGAIGKWHLGMGNGNVNWNENIKPGAKEVGFDYSNIIAATNDRVPTVFVENGDVVNLDKNDPIYVRYDKPFEGEPTAITNPELQTTVTWHHGHNGTVVNGIPRIGFMKGGEAARWKDEDQAEYFLSKFHNFMDENKEKPFFLYYGLHQPHVPRAPHSRFVGSTTMGPRGDAIVEADYCVGQIIERLEKEGLLENTIIFFSSDNGFVLNDGYNDGAVEKLGEHDPSGGFNGGKYSLYDGGTHVPFFVYWKGKIKPMVSNTMVSQLDILASVAELVDGEVPEGLDSQNHLDVFLGKSYKGRTDYIFEAGGRTGYMNGSYTLIPPYKGAKVNKIGTNLGGFDDYALFDISKDRSQQNDISKQHPEKLEEMKAEYAKQVGDYYNINIPEIILK